MKAPEMKKPEAAEVLETNATMEVMKAKAATFRLLDCILIKVP